MFVLGLPAATQTPMPMYTHMHAACGLNAIHAMVILGSMVQTLGPAHGSSLL